MSSPAIVIQLDVFKDLSFGFFTRLEPVSMNQLDLERVKEALSDGVVPAVPLATHAADEFILGQDGFEIIPGKLTASVRMTNQTFVRASPQDRLSHRLRGQRVGNGLIHRQTNDSPRKQIEDRRHV